MVGLAENKATQPSLAGAWAELGILCFKILGEIKLVKKVLGTRMS